MPNVTATPKGLVNGEVVTEFTDTTGTASVTYTYQVPQSGISIENSGVADIFVTVGTYSNQVVNPDKTWRADTPYTAFSIRSNVNSQEFIATAFQNDVDSSGVADLVARSMVKQAKREGNPFVQALGNHLSMGVEPAVLLLQGDSTGNETTEWFYKTMQWLARQYPSYSFVQRLWSDTYQNYSGTRSVIQYGSAGDAYAALPGTSGNYISTPDSVPLSIAGDIDIRAKVSLNNWKPGSDAMALVDKLGNTGDRGWHFGIDGTAGKPYFWWSADGTNLLGGITATGMATVAPVVANGATLWLRVTVDVDNGAAGHTIRFYTSNDGFAWTQLGADIVNSGTTSIFNNTASVSLGSRGGTLNLWAGKYFYAEVRNGIDGRIVASPDFDLTFPVGKATFNDTEQNTWTVNDTGVTVGNGSPGVLVLNGSHPGAALAYSTDATRFGIQTPLEPVLAFISYGHNETTKVAYQVEYEGLANQLRTKFPNVGIVCVTQNPQKDSSTNTFEYPIQHAQRNRQVATLAAKNNYGLIDAYRAFMESGNYQVYVNDDGVHPNQAGEDLWANEAIRFLSPAVF